MSSQPARDVRVPDDGFTHPLSTITDEIVCAETPEPFLGVGRWYADFSQTTDAEVHELLERARGGMHATA